MLSATGDQMLLSQIIERLTQCAALVQDICTISGVPGLSIGILHDGQVIYRHNWGWRDVGRRLRTTSNTIYSLGSMTKAFTASALAIQFSDRTDGLGWNSLVEDLLPEFCPNKGRPLGHLSIADLMSHRSGLSGDMSMVIQGNDDFLLAPEELIPSLNNLDQIAPPRQQWIYNNWGYSTAGAILEELSKQPFADYVNETVLGPLGLSQTTLKPNFSPGKDFAEPYVALPDGTFSRQPRPFLFKDSIFEAAGGICSNINDLLKWSKAVLHAEAHPDDSPLKDIATLISNQIPLDNPSRDFRFYGMGWIRTQLPGVVGLQGDNAELFSRSELPVLGNKASSMITYYHQSNAPGYNGAIYLFPETTSGVVVLTNSKGLNDASDWIAQVYISALFNFDHVANYTDLARESRKRNLDSFDSMMDAIDKIRRDHAGQKPRPWRDYVGIYAHPTVKFHIEILPSEDGKTLRLSFQSKDTQTFPLRHLHDEVFEWAMPYAEQARTMMFPFALPEYFRVLFNFSVDSTARSLAWAFMDEENPGGIVLERRQDPVPKQTGGYFSMLQKLLWR